MKRYNPLLMLALSLISCQGMPGENVARDVKQDVKLQEKPAPDVSRTDNVPAKEVNRQEKNEAQVVVPSLYADLVARIGKAKSGDTIQVPEGTYNVDATEGLILDGLTNIVLKATGENTKLVSDSPNVTILTIRNCKNLTIDGFTIYHRVDTSCIASCISVEASHTVTITHCDIHGSGAYGIFVTGDTDSTKVDILKNEIHNCSYYGIEYHAENGRIAGNHFYANYFGDMLIDGEYASGIILEDNRQEPTENNTVDNPKNDTDNNQDNSPEYNADNNTEDNSQNNTDNNAEASSQYNTDESTEGDAQYNTDNNTDDHTNASNEDAYIPDDDSEANEEDNSSAADLILPNNLWGYWAFSSDGSQGGGFTLFGDGTVQLKEATGTSGIWEYRDGTIYMGLNSESQEPGADTTGNNNYSFTFKILKFTENYMSVRITSANEDTQTVGLYKLVN